MLICREHIRGLDTGRPIFHILEGINVPWRAPWQQTLGEGSQLPFSAPVSSYQVLAMKPAVRPLVVGGMPSFILRLPCNIPRRGLGHERRYGLPLYVYSPQEGQVR